MFERITITRQGLLTGAPIDLGFLAECLIFYKKGSVAEFVGKRAVEKAAAWKSPPAGLSPSA
jgi:hypothetical protein